MANSDSDPDNLEQDEILPIAVSCGEVFIVESYPQKWWIGCNNCQHKFDVLEDFLNHTINQHLAKQTNLILKTGSISTKNTKSTLIEDKGNSSVLSTRSEEDESSLEDVDLYSEAENEDQSTDVQNKVIVISDENTNSTSAEDEDTSFQPIGDIETTISEKDHNGDDENNVDDQEIIENNKPKLNIKPKPNSSPNPILENSNPTITINTNENRERFPCSECDKTYASKRRQREHIASHFQLQPLLKCDKCGGIYKSKTTLKNHKLTHTGERPFKCHLCPKDYRTRTALTNHITTHTGETRFSCSFCEKRFYTKVSFKEHERIHTGEMPFICETCGRKFRVKAVFITHRKSHENASQKSKMVETGEQSKRGPMSYSERKSRPKKRFQCEICIASFAFKDALVEHEKTIHVKSKEYVCKICNDHFPTRASVCYHVEKDHRCTPVAKENYCVKNNEVNESMKRELLIKLSSKPINRKEKKFVCKICATIFGTKKSLRMHEYIHKETKDYSCNLCEKKFRTYADINYHLKRKHNCVAKANCNYALLRQNNPN